MNICIVSTYSCTFDQFKELVDESMEEAKAFMSDYELVKENENKLFSKIRAPSQKNKSYWSNY